MLCVPSANQSKCATFYGQNGKLLFECLEEEAWRLKVITVEAVLPADGGATREGRMGLELEPGLIIEC